MPDILLDTRSAAERIGLSKSFLDRLRVSGRGPAFLKLGGRVLYREQDLAGWLEAARHSSTAEYSRRTQGAA